MLEVRGRLAVGGHADIASFLKNDPFVSKIENGLDGDHHAGLQDGTFAGIAEIRDERIFVDMIPDAMSRQLFYHAEFIGDADRFDGITDISDAPASFGSFYAGHERFFRSCKKP